MNDDTQSDNNWAENLANLGKAIGPFLPKFRNLRKVRDRLLGDVTEAAFDALVSRLRLYRKCRFDTKAENGSWWGRRMNWG